VFPEYLTRSSRRATRDGIKRVLKLDLQTYIAGVNVGIRTLLAQGGDRVSRQEPSVA
jgi:hypothetical protein